MDGVFRIADWITVMANGVVIASGTPDFVRNSADVRVAYMPEGRGVFPNLTVRENLVIVASSRCCRSAARWC
jgi:ABC-type uncharacterized transport system ATPase subunit